MHHAFDKRTELTLNTVQESFNVFKISQIILMKLLLSRIPKIIVLASKIG